MVVLFMVCVDPGGLEIAVTQQLLNRPDVEVGLEQVAGKTVTEGMRRGPLVEPGIARPLPFRFALTTPSTLPNSLPNT
jgi:hypothetical protein